MNNYIFDFEKLTVYQKSLNFIDEIFVQYKNLGQEYKYSIGNNLIRASLSVANNLAEGNDKKSKKDKKRFFEYSSDSARECVSVFNVLKRQSMMREECYVALRGQAREITSMLRALIENL